VERERERRSPPPPYDDRHRQQFSREGSAAKPWHRHDQSRSASRARSSERDRDRPRDRDGRDRGERDHMSHRAPFNGPSSSSSGSGSVLRPPGPASASPSVGGGPTPSHMSSSGAGPSAHGHSKSQTPALEDAAGPSLHEPPTEAQIAALPPFERKFIELSLAYKETLVQAQLAEIKVAASLAIARAKASFLDRPRSPRGTMDQAATALPSSSIYAPSSARSST
jgi:hypothetical protein